MEVRRSDVREAQFLSAVAVNRDINFLEMEKEQRAAARINNDIELFF